jgi:hypothetical protein
MPSLDEIRASIETRIAQVQAEIDSLQAARDALRTDGGAGPVTRTRDRSTRRAKAPKATRPGPRPAADPETATSPSEVPAEPPLKPAAATRPNPRPRAPRAPAKSPKSSEVLLAGKLEAMLRQAGHGLSARAIAKAAKARDRQVRALLSERESSGHVRRAGTGRGTRWRLITDEERVAARAAELQKLRTVKS